jgi:4-carboxymuconolactone decarboxylase
MESEEERFHLGVALMREMVGDEAADRALANHAEPDKDVPGQLLDWAIPNAFGFLLRRPGLSMRDKTIAMISVDISTMKSRGALREHVRLALLNGVTSDEIYEVCFLLVWYVGMPTIREAIEEVRVAVEEFESAGDAASETGESS